jgi:D-aspartate ligase
MIIDIPTSVIGMPHGRPNLNSHSTSIGSVGVESVFGREDILPSLAEIALLPYVAVKRGL